MKTRPIILESIYNQSQSAIVIIDNNCSIIDWSEKQKNYIWKFYGIFYKYGILIRLTTF